MARVAFIGLGNMGGGMAANLAKSGHDVRAFDLSEAALKRASERGCLAAASAAEAVKEAEAVVTMLPAGSHVRDVYESSVIGQAPSIAAPATVHRGSAGRRTRPVRPWARRRPGSGHGHRRP